MGVEEKKVGGGGHGRGGGDVRSLRVVGESSRSPTFWGKA